MAQRWGGATYQAARNDWQQNGRDSFLVEAGKYGLGRRDLCANVNWFSKVAVEDDGALAFDAQQPKPGAFVDLRFEMDTLVLLHTCPHPLNPTTDYPRKSVTYQMRPAETVTGDDACITSHPENGRGFENSRLYHAGCCAAQETAR